MRFTKVCSDLALYPSSKMAQYPLNIYRILKRQSVEKHAVNLITSFQKNTQKNCTNHLTFLRSQPQDQLYELKDPWKGQ